MIYMEKRSSLGNTRTANQTGRGMLDEDMIKRLLGEDTDKPEVSRHEDVKKHEGRQNAVLSENEEPDSANNCKYPLDGYPLAMVYSPRQKFEDIYNESDALNRGTIFEALDLPFVGSCHKAE